MKTLMLIGIWLVTLTSGFGMTVAISFFLSPTAAPLIGFTWTMLLVWAAFWATGEVMR